MIVAPLGNQGTVLGLGGNDTICLVDGASSTVARSDRVGRRRGWERLGAQHAVRGIGQRRARRRRGQLRRQRLPRAVYGAWSSGPPQRHRDRRLRDRRRGRLDHVRGARGRERRQHLDGRRQRQHHGTAVPRPVAPSTTVRPPTPPAPGQRGRATSSSTTSLAGPASGAARCSPGRPSTGSRCARPGEARSPSSAPTRTRTSTLTAPSATWPRRPDLHGRRRRQRRPRELPARQRRPR